MKKYCVIFLKRLAVQLSYKFNFITSLFTNLLTILISVFTWLAIFQSNGSQEIAGYSQAQMLYYIIFVNIGTSIFTTNLVVGTGQLVRSGKLTSHLLRPYSLLWKGFAEFLGSRFLLIALYFLGICGLILASGNLVQLGILTQFFLINLLMFYLLMSLIGNLGFWLVQIWPLRPVMNAVYIFLGGLLFPLDLFPPVLYRILAYNPFSILSYQYVRAVQGILPQEEVLFLSLVSLAWCLVFYGLYQLSFARGLKRYEGMGA